MANKSTQEKWKNTGRNSFSTAILGETKATVRMQTYVLGDCGILDEVGYWSKAFRCTALFLLLFVAVEVLACDLLPSDDCYISSHLPTTPDKNHGQGSDDTCLCCCQHMAVTIALIFVPQETVTLAPPEEPVEQPLFVPSYIDHPPRLS